MQRITTFDAMRVMTVLLALAFCAPLRAAVQLAPLVDGLSSPVFVTHAGDGSNRLFIVEQGGVVRVAQPGSGTSSVFLDIRAKVTAGGEQGLLGLAFHPSHAQNGRFFVYYTRSGDGAIVIAEYRVSANRDVAIADEAMLLTIPHPVNTNHNGGMLAFGPDGYLYVGVGDGGSANDPPNNAQNLDALLGKILRLDVDHDSQGAPYAVPADNPLVGLPGRDEIYAYGLRNPWRFSFDRVTGVLWVADVGQGAREEVDMPVVRGGNYGWRIYEGSSCSGNDPLLCNPANYQLPIFDYTHDGGRCSITGGYVYRGNQQALPAGTYVYGDYCSGEIFAWNGVERTVLLDTPGNIASFGEDEHGELLVVDLGGTVSRLTATGSCRYSIAPKDAIFAKAGGAASITVTTDSECSWTAATTDEWITLNANAGGSGSGTITYTVAPYAGKPKTRSGTIVIAGLTFTITQNRLRLLVRGGGGR